MSSMQERYGEPISVYTSDQALDDGVLVEASPRTHPNMLLTAAVVAKIMQRPEMKEADGREAAVGSQIWQQRVVPLLMDVVNIAKMPANRNDSLYTGNGLDGNLTGKTLWFAMNEMGGITIMFPSDY